MNWIFEADFAIGKRVQWFICLPAGCQADKRRRFPRCLSQYTINSELADRQSGFILFILLCLGM